MPSSVGYLLGAFVAALALFFGLWWMLISGGDEAPWIPAGLAASVVLLVALSAREVVMRRAWTRYLLEQGGEPGLRSSGEHKHSSSSKTRTSAVLSAAARVIQKRSEEADGGSGRAGASAKLAKASPADVGQKFFALADLRSATAFAHLG